MLPELVLPLADQYDGEVRAGGDAVIMVCFCCGCGCGSACEETALSKGEEVGVDGEVEVELQVNELVDDEESSERDDASTTVCSERTDVKECACPFPFVSSGLVIRGCGEAKGLEQVDDTEESGLDEPHEAEERDMLVLNEADDETPSVVLGKLSTESGVG